MIEPSTLVPALEYGALGLAFIVVISMIVAGGWLLRRFTDNMIDEAGKASTRADDTVKSIQSIAEGAVASNVKSTAVLEKISGQLDTHDDRTSAAHVEVLRSLANIQGTLNKPERR